MDNCKQITITSQKLFAKHPETFATNENIKLKFYLAKSISFEYLSYLLTFLLSFSLFLSHALSPFLLSTVLL